MVASHSASPTGRLEADVSTCGNSADSLETTVWFGDAKTKARALHASMPVDHSLFDRGAPELTSTFAREFQLTWVDESHLEISLPPGITWKRDEDSFRGVSVSYEARSD